MARRRPRPKLSAIATLDVDIACARQQCEDRILQASNRLTQSRNGSKPSFHDRYLENLRGFFDSEAIDKQINASKWPQPTLQAFLTRFFAVYDDPDAFAAVCGALQAENAVCGLENGEKWIKIESFDALKRVLRDDTATRLPNHDPHTHTFSTAAMQEPEHSPPEQSPPDQQRDSTLNPVELVDDTTPYTVPATSVVLGSELRIDVLKKSQNWLGRWRSRQLRLRWNELEMTSKSGIAAASNSHTHSQNRHSSVTRSFPSQLPVLSTAASTAAKSYGPPPSSLASADPSSGSSAGSGSANAKKYPLQNLISLQLIQLNDSEPTRKVAVDLHFKQRAANGHGFTTKSLIVTPSEKGQQQQPPLTAKELMNTIATLALFRALVAGELKPLIMQKWVHAGANGNAFCAVPMPTASLRLQSLTLCPLQFAFRQYCQLGDAAWLATARMLVKDAKADPRSLLHWQFARRVLQQRSTKAIRALVALLLDSSCITAFGSDAHGWTLLMYVSQMGDPAIVQELLDRAKTTVKNEELARYIQHVNGDGDTALGLAIKARGGEDAAIAIVDAYVSTRLGNTSDVVALVSASGDAMGTSETVLQLALAAKLWRLVDVLLLQQQQQQHPHATSSVDPEDTNAAILLQAIRSHAPCHVVASIVERCKEKWARDGDTLMATALTLAVEKRRDDMVEILLHAGAGAALPEAAICGDDSVMHVAIRTGMADAARSIWAAYSRTGAVLFPSLVLLALRQGMYRLAYEMATSHDGRSALERDVATAVAEASVVAVRAGQLELASVLLDIVVAACSSGGEQLPSEKVLQALLTWTAPFKSPLKDDEASLFTMQVIEEMATELLVRTETVDLYKFPPLLQATCSLRGGSKGLFSRRVLVLLLAFLRWKHGDPRAILTTQVDGVTRETVLHIAMANGSFSCALQLLHELFATSVSDKPPPDEDQEDDDGDDDDMALQWMETPHATLLHLACRAPLAAESLMVVDLLLQFGAYAGSWDASGHTALHVAIYHQCDARMVQVFAKHDQDLNVWSDAIGGNVGDDDPVQLTPLMAAIESNNVVAFRELVRCGADLRLKTPRQRLGILEFAASRNDATVELAMLQELLKLKLLGASRATMATDDDVLGILRDRLRRLEASRDRESLPVVTEDDNRVLRITLLGLQTRNDDVDVTTTTSDAALDDIPITVTNTPPLSPRNPRSPFPSPPRSPLRLSSIERRGSGRQQQQIPSPAAAPVLDRVVWSREPSPVRRPVAPAQLDDDALRFLRDEERATLTLVAQEAKAEAQQWLAKRSGQKKLLSEARALLQSTGTSTSAHHHRRSPSGGGGGGSSSVSAVETIVTDEQLLETYKTLAAREFIDKHVAEAVGDARAAIDREKMAVLQATGIFPGDAHGHGHHHLPAGVARPKDASIGSTSSLSSSSTVKMHRTASMNSSMLLLFSGSESDTFLSERGGAGAGGTSGDVSYEELLLSSSLDRESFVHHIADARKSLS